MKALTILFTLFLFVHVNAQVNAYAQVSAISSTTLSISSSDETYGSFSVGMPVIVMQMQDDVIGSNVQNTNLFGTLSSIQTAGQYEVANITAISRSGGSITQITIGGALSNTYNIGANKTVQVVSYPLLGSPNYTTTGNITAVPWNGSLGGVVAFRVAGTLTLNHNITADNAGFRGGSLNAGNAASCDYGTFITGANENNANKGEGIYKSTNVLYAAGRGRVLNGGGGGNSHNGGGGGGSNASSGGEGGKGYSCTSNAGGLGGSTLYSFVSSSRVFMGGGGGAGEGNNNYNTAGGNGGGIVIISANQIATTGSGAQKRISANGQSAADVGNDGAGGGGAGGAVILSVNSWNVVSSKTLLISANGGDGGNVGDAAAHGGGGGGGQGVVLFSTAMPTTNITTRTLNGSGGRNYAGGTFAESGGGSDNAGIITGSFALLPVKILEIKGRKVNGSNEIRWYSVQENKVEFYEVQRSYNGSVFRTVSKIHRQAESYAYYDESQNEDVYYRIAIHEAVGHVSYSGVVLIKSASSGLNSVELAPNPVVSDAVITVNAKHNHSATISIFNTLGMIVKQARTTLVSGDNRIKIETGGMVGGTYHIVVNTESSSTPVKMIVQR